MDQQPSKRRSLAAPLVTLLCSVVLAGGSCYALVSSFTINGRGKDDALNVFFLIVFFSNVVAAPASIVWMIARAIRNRRTENKDRQ
ncbi:MAG TPA: hypothetical protein VKP58_09330 [Candidatus Acidoferrum sp.]|jgi:hypothetical protein|nr:hypothetical protein [Candidatus Acidoferrum sp.]